METVHGVDNTLFQLLYCVLFKAVPTCAIKPKQNQVAFGFVFVLVCCRCRCRLILLHVCD